ncbi:MAG: hypothetical protein Q9215_007922 [Flavoplaca cf. flavocitrina]
MAIRTLLRASAPLRCIPHHSRGITTLSNNPHIYIFPSSNQSHLLSLLPTNPPNPNLAIATTSAIPPTPASVKENPSFLDILQDVLRKWASQDPDRRRKPRIRRRAIPLAAKTAATAAVFTSHENQYQYQYQHKHIDSNAKHAASRRRGRGEFARRDGRRRERRTYPRL